MRKKNIRLMCVIALLQGMVFYAPIATLYRQAQGVSLLQITVIESISLALLILLEIPWGYIADRIGYKKTMLICNALYFVSKIVFWQATGFSWFLAERLMLSVVLSGLSGCDSAYLYSAAGEENSHRVFGVYTAMGAAGLVVASVVFSAVIVDDYRLSGFLTMIAYGISMLLTFFLGEVKPEKSERCGFRRDVKEIASALISGRRFLLFLAASMLLAESNQTLTVFISQVQYIRAGIPQQLFGYIYILVTLAGLLAASSAKLASRLGEQRMSRMLFTAAGIGCVISAISLNPLICVLMIVLIRVSASLFQPISMKIQNRHISVANRATMLSVYSCVMNAGAIFTNLIFGRLAETDISLAFYMGSVFCLAGLILFSLWAKKERRI